MIKKCKIAYIKSWLHIFAFSFTSYIPQWIGVLGLFLVVHATQNRLSSFITIFAHFSGWEMLNAKKEAFITYAPSFKGLVFLISLVLVSWPAVRDASSRLVNSEKQQVLKNLAFSLFSIFILFALTFYFKNASMGNGYARRSLAPFEQVADWYHKRLLMPALAHILFLRGNWLYFIFGFIITFCFLCALRRWTEEHSPLPIWQFISLCTSSFVIYQFQFPSYPDIMAFYFLILVMSNGFSQLSKIGLLVLALVTHEATIFIGSLLAWRYLDRKHFISYLLMISVYFLFWFIAYRGSFDNLISSHDVRGMSGVQWVLQRPLMTLLGLFIAFKLLWILPLLSVLIDIKRQELKRAIFVVAGCAISILMVCLGVDTSRMAGWTFPAILISIETLEKNLTSRKASFLLKTVFLINLIIPSFYVGLNTGIELREGIYKCIYKFIFR